MNDMRKILFLDIDGVCNHTGTFDKAVHFPIDKYCAFLVGKIQLDTGCEVVLSSSWRKLGEEALAEIEKRIVKITDITGTCCSGIRGVEINNWINKNIPWQDRYYEGGKKRDDRFRYAILDDDSDMLLWQKDHFFQTSFMNGGLTKEIADQVTEHLNRV